jgi:hypothetical protein
MDRVADAYAGFTRTSVAILVGAALLASLAVARDVKGTRATAQARGAKPTGVGVRRCSISGQRGGNSDHAEGCRRWRHSRRADLRSLESRHHRRHRPSWATWIGGVAFALAAAPVGCGLLVLADQRPRQAFLLH